MDPRPLLNVAAAVAIATVPPIAVGNLTGEGLTLEWSVDKYAGPTPDQAEVNIYNLDPVSRRRLEAYASVGVPANVVLSVGWGGAPELLFQGLAWRIRAERRTGVDIITTLECGDGLSPYQQAASGGTPNLALGIRIVISKMLGELGIAPSPAALSTIESAAAAVRVTTFRGVPDGSSNANAITAILASLGLGWGIDRGLFVVYRNGLRDDLPPSELGPLSGLLNLEPLQEGGVEFEALAQPRVVPGLQVLFRVPEDVQGITVMRPYGGPLRVERVSFRGSTRGESTMSGIARKVEVF